MQNSALALRPIGFIDDNPALLNRTISGIPVLGSSKDLPVLLDDHLVTSFLVSSKSIQQDRMKDVAKACKERGVNVLLTSMELQPLPQELESLDQPTYSTRPAA
jgi:FlaA1/EpsC-like NDP-sugar epimerase